MSEAAKNLSAAEYLLKVSSGPDKGSVYQLVSNKISLGRAPENDISFPEDPKISRKHVVISIDDDRCRITDISGKNFMLIDGEKCKEAELFDGTRVKIGETEFCFQVADNNSEPSKAVAVNGGPINAAPHGQLPANPSLKQQAEALRLDRQYDQQFQAPSQSNAPGQPLAAGLPTPNQGPPQKKNNRLRFYLIVAIIGLLFFWLLSSTPELTEDKLKVRDTEEILKEQEASKKRQEAINMKKMELGKDTRQYDEAQASYIRCFRDYQQGQYTRAIQHCQAALSIFPNHELAERYLNLNKRMRDRSMQFLTRKGKMYLERGHYTRCMATLTQVMYDLKSPQHPLFKEARQLHAECKAQQEGRY